MNLELERRGTLLQQEKLQAFLSQLYYLAIGRGKGMNTPRLTVYTCHMHNYKLPSSGSFHAVKLVKGPGSTVTADILSW